MNGMAPWTRVLVAEESMVMDDPTVKKPESWDDEMDGSWDAPKVRLGRAVKPRYEPMEPFASPSVLSPVPCEAQRVATPADGTLLRCASAAAAAPVLVRIGYTPLRIEVLDAATQEAVIRLNGRRKLLYEPFRQLIPSGEAEAKAPEPVKFNSHSDPMVFGSSSVGMDADFPQATHVYGLPERALSLALPSTLGREPYRLFNLDVFEYLLDHPMGLYGSVPFVQAR